MIKSLPNHIQRKVRLAPYTTWKIGGDAEYFSTPSNQTELIQSLQWAENNEIPRAIIGRGSNLLIADEGYRGLVICLRNFEIDSKAKIISPQMRGDVEKIEISSGTSLPRLAKIAAELGWKGYEFLIGIPGTVGGALYMNAGYKMGEKEDMAHLCESVKWINEKNEVVEDNYNRFEPKYRKSNFQTDFKKGIILSAQFKSIGRGNKEEIRRATATHLSMRKQMQPLSAKTAGSVFKGLSDGKPAALLIDRAGLKGYSIGGARISPKHANWIENHDNATAKDILDLITAVQKIILEKEGVLLEPEIQRL